MSSRRVVLGVVVALAALAGHLWFHYLPRARPAVPGDSPVAALLAEGDFPAAIWVPFPHQNLAHLRAAVGADAASLRAVARLAGLPSPALPTFGPLALPPSSEIAVASDDTGERFVVVAQVYPAVAYFARLAGRLAGNPWLKGGEILVEGRPAQARWQGNRWTVASVDPARPEPVPAAAAGDGPAAPGLVWIRVRQAGDPLPAGLYRMWQDGGDLGITTRVGGAAPESSGLAGRLDQLGLFLLVYAGRQPALGEPAQALAFFDQRDRQEMELPRVASLHEPGTERWDLPGESLLEIAGRRPLTASAPGWSLAALDSTSLDQARRVAPELDAAEPRRIRWGLWLDFRGGLAEVERIAGLLGKVPIVSRRQVERWNDARAALSPLAARFSHLTATITDQPRVFDLRLEGRPESAPADSARPSSKDGAGQESEP